MNLSAPFIHRPVATTLLAVGLFLVGMVAYFALPVANLPSVDFPTIRVFASRPGADPAIMAATVAAPLERRLGEIAGVTEITSQSTLGSSNITVQFDLARGIDSAARDVQAALNAAATDLPPDLPTLPIFRKSNPAAAPVLILALTSRTVRGTAVYDAADTVIAQRIAQVEGVAEVTVSGADQPAIRVQVDPQRLAAMGVSTADVRNAVVAANVESPLGAFENAAQAETLSVNGQLTRPEDFASIVVAQRRGTVVRLGDVAKVEQGVRNRRSAGWFNGEPAVLIQVSKQSDANVIQTVDRVKALIPEFRRWIPAGIEVSILSDRTQTIRASVADMQLTLAITVALVMMVVLVFLRRATPTLAAGVTIPLSLAGTFALMWCVGFSLDNLSLMAITIAVGFVVDDAIVMIENVERHAAAGLGPVAAALAGARQVAFTVVSISLSLVAAFIPLLFMDGVVGRVFRSFSLTLTFAIVVSTLVSLTVAPMICGRFGMAHRPEGRLGRGVDRGLALLTRAYDRSLGPVLDHPWLTVAVFVAVIGLTVQLFREAPKGMLPQDDNGLIFAFTQASPTISFPAMAELQQRATDAVRADPAVAGVGSFVGGGFGAVNNGRMFITLKEPKDRPGATTMGVIGRLRTELTRMPGIRVFMVPAQDAIAGGRQGRAQYQFTLWGPDGDALYDAVPRVLERLRAVPGLVDVSTDREQGGLQASVVIDRTAASRLGVDIQAIDEALNNAFAQRQISTVYTQRNQYRVVLESPVDRQQTPDDLSRLYVTAAGGPQVPLTAVARIERTAAPLVVNHQGQFPSVTITFNLSEGAVFDEAVRGVNGAIAELHLPDSVRAEFAGDAKSRVQSGASQGMLIAAAFLAVYLILGILYESLIHPLTIISTLPSAALGALIALRLGGLEVTIIAFIGIILLIGIVKKNGIMLVDFALEAERHENLSPREAIHRACLERFRPILMTTLAAILGAVPLAVSAGAGAELRRPLGITIVGGLVLSQVLTLYTTPVIYLLLDRLRRRSPRMPARLQDPLPAPAE